MLLQVVIGVSAYQDGSTLEMCKSLEGGGSITLGVAPFSLTVEMIVGDHSFPQSGNFVICQTNITAGNRTPGKATDKKVFHITSKFLTDSGKIVPYSSRWWLDGRPTKSRRFLFYPSECRA